MTASAGIGPTTVDNESCVVLVPVAATVHPECERGLRDLERDGYTVRRVYGHSAIDSARCQIATDALRDGFEELMWIDADVAFDAADVGRLRSHDRPFVCAIYPKKGVREVSCHVVPGTDRLVFGEEGGLAPILYAAAGFLLTRRQVYVDIKKTLALPTCNTRFGHPLDPYFQPMTVLDGDGHWYLAEDFAFSERARRAGHEVLADTTIRLRHMGDYGYRWEDAGSELGRYATYTLNLTKGSR